MILPSDLERLLFKMALPQFSLKFLFVVNFLPGNTVISINWYVFAWLKLRKGVSRFTISWVKTKSRSDICAVQNQKKTSLENRRLKETYLYICHSTRFWHVCFFCSFGAAIDNGGYTSYHHHRKPHLEVRKGGHNKNIKLARKTILFKSISVVGTGDLAQPMRSCIGCPSQTMHRKTNLNASDYMAVKPYQTLGMNSWGQIIILNNLRYSRNSM